MAEAQQHAPHISLWIEMQSNKRLEIIGDAYLKAAWVRALVDEYPMLTASGLHVRHSSDCRPVLAAAPTLKRPVTQALSQRLIGNTFLSRLAWAYGGFGSIARAEMERPGGVFLTQKASADLVEAFVGAVTLDRPDGHAVIVTWFRMILTSGALPSIATDAEVHLKGEAQWRTIRKKGPGGRKEGERKREWIDVEGGTSTKRARVSGAR